MTIIDQLRRDEGTRLKPYRDTRGKLTIGTGRNLDDVGISQGEADYMLGNDISNARSQLLAAEPWAINLDNARFGCLLNMAFNMGVPKLLGFKDTLGKVQSGDYAGAAEAMLDSNWAKQVGARAQRLSQQMANGEWV